MLRKSIVFFMVLLLTFSLLHPVSAITANDIWSDGSYMEYRILGEEIIANQSLSSSDKGYYNLEQNYYDTLRIDYVDDDGAEIKVRVTIGNMSSFLWFENGTTYSLDSDGLIGDAQFSGLFTDPAIFMDTPDGGKIDDFVVTFDHKNERRTYQTTMEGTDAYQSSDIPEISVYLLSLNDSRPLSYYVVSQYSGVMVEIMGSSEYTDPDLNLEYDLDYRLLLTNYSGVHISEPSGSLLAFSENAWIFLTTAGIILAMIAIIYWKNTRLQD